MKKTWPISLWVIKIKNKKHVDIERKRKRETFRKT